MLSMVREQKVSADMMLIVLSGDLFFVRILDQKVVVINSQRVARALLHNRSRIYSDRPYLATVEPCVSLFVCFFVESV